MPSAALPVPLPIPTSITISTRDNYSVAATLYGESGTGPVVLINSGTGIPQEFYKKFAQYLAANDCTVVTYDYRGIGQSRSGPIQSHPGTMKDWAKQDAQAVSDWLAARYVGRPLSAIGHSFGGQAFALMTGNTRFARVALVASQSGYWRLFDGLHRAKTFVLWHVLARLITPMLGYFPASKLGLGADLPAGVMQQWAAWGRHPEYLMGEFGHGETNRFMDIQSPILMLSANDDPIAPARGVAALRAYLPAGKLHHSTIDARKLPARVLGHFGFFREQNQATLWAPMLAFLLGTDTNPYASYEATPQ